MGEKERAVHDLAGALGLEVKGMAEILDFTDKEYMQQQNPQHCRRGGSDWTAYWTPEHERVLQEEIEKGEDND